MQTNEKWESEDQEFWKTEGKAIANRNLWISIPALLLAFAVWQLWSVVAVNLNSAGFNYAPEQLFTLAALPGLTGATTRFLYSFTVPIFGGRNWTVLSTASLLIPVVGIGLAVQNPETSFTTMAILAAFCGLGGGNFASSMSHISFFFPKKVKGTAMGLNAGLGNLGVSTVQFLAPLVITVGIFGSLGGAPQILMKNGIEQHVFLQNAAFIWVIPIILSTAAAFWGMNNLATAKASVREQLVVLKRKHTWLMSWLYTMCFGSFIGFSAAFPLLIKTLFPEVNALQLAFLGPLVGAASRPVGGWLGDKFGGARMTTLCIIAMIGAALGAIFFINSNSFVGFFIMFLLLFITAGIANGSTFRMIPIIFPPKEAAAVLGITSAIAAYAAFFIPKSFSWSLKATASPNNAILAFIVFYVISLGINWYYYDRKNAEIKC